MFWYSVTSTANSQIACFNMALRELSALEREMRLKFFVKPVAILVEQFEPIIGRRKFAPIVSAVPSGSLRRFDRLDQFSITVEDVDLGRCLPRQSADIPKIMVTVSVGRKEPRIIEYENLESQVRTAI